MKTRRLFATIIMLIALVGVTAYANDGNENPMESLYGEWRLVGWSDEGSWFEVNTNYVGHHRLSIEIPKEGRVVAYSMANEIFLGTLTLNGNELIFGGGAMTMIGFDKYENLFFEDHIIEIKSYKLDGNSLRLYYTDEDYFLFTKYFDVSADYFPQGTKWTEIRLDTLKYDSWYSKVGDEWVPNFETIEYHVKGEYVEKVGDERRTFRTVYTNGPEWADSLTLMLWEGTYCGDDKYVLATIPPIIEADGSSYVLWPAEAYHFDWNLGKMIKFKDIISSNATAIYPPNKFDFGKIGEIKEGEFGGARSLKYADVNGVRIIQGIGVTTWNDGECLFGPVKPYDALRFFGPSDPDIILDRNEYRSMLVHFESNGEVLYDVWPEKPENIVTFTQGQMATIILPTDPDPELGKYYRLDRRQNNLIVFEEEHAPKAHVPYIILPKKDFVIDLSTLDLEGCYRDSVFADGITFIGSFVSEEVECAANCYIDIIDLTPDCHEDIFCEKKPIIGALRAFLRVDTHWEDPYNAGGTRSIAKQEKLQIILLDNNDASAINDIQEETINGKPTDGVIYDLTGRKVNWQLSTGNCQLPKGIYIRNGKRFLVK